VFHGAVYAEGELDDSPAPFPRARAAKRGALGAPLDEGGGPETTARAVAHDAAPLTSSEPVTEALAALLPPSGEPF
jgi:hypothetical protein